MEITEGTIVTFRKSWLKSFGERHAKATGKPSDFHEGMVGIVERVTTRTQISSFRTQSRRNLSTSEAFNTKKTFITYQIVWEHPTKPGEILTNKLPASAVKIAR